MKYSPRLRAQTWIRDLISVWAASLLVSNVRAADSPFDTSVCSPPKNSAVSPLPALGDVYSASIRWTSELDKKIYDVRDDYDKRRGQAALTVNMPRLPAAAKMIYDLKLGYVSVIKDGRLGTASMTWQMPEVPHDDRSLPYIIKLHAKRTQSGVVQEYKVTGTVSRFDVSPVFEDAAFLPPPGTWCEGLASTSLPDLPASFSLVAEMVYLDSSKVSLHKVRCLYIIIITYPELGVKYNIDNNLQACDRISPITMYDDFAEPAPVKQISPHEFRLAQASVFFRTRGARVQLAGQRTIRGITCDVYIGQYPDPDKHRNFTVQWFFSKAHWQVYSGASILSEALVRMEVYMSASGNPIVYNIIGFERSEPDYDVFDISLCYTPQQKIHFLLLIKVLEPAAFSSVSPRSIQDRITEMLASLITEQNRFAGIQVEYDGKENLYVYGTLLERPPVDNTDIQHPQPHTMEDAFLFLGGSVRSQISSYIVTPEGKNVTLVPTRIVRVDFAKDFTTPLPTKPTTTQAPPIPPRKTTPTTTPTTTRRRTTPSTGTRSSSSRSPAPARPPSANWQNCRPLCLANQMCPCNAQPSIKVPTHPTPPCDCAQDCPATTSRSNTNSQGACGHINGGQKDQKKSSSKSGISVGTLVGSVLGVLVVGLILGFVATRLYHVLKKLPDVRLINSDDDVKY
ncbi:hypothetical protein EGW08_020083 [Elysia chlorotica]|uniref:LolA-like domain-containing protein n=1 Tax=Elysia chlorotica TaxID=188477 RepID=A0A433SSE5_ELYCH|nr:hypothetical protein EGW08_020083 [Elysia chlorotica]